MRFLGRHVGVHGRASPQAHRSGGTDARGCARADIRPNRGRARVLLLGRSEILSLNYPCSSMGADERRGAKITRLTWGDCWVRCWAWESVSVKNSTLWKSAATVVAGRGSAVDSALGEPALQQHLPRRLRRPRCVSRVSRAQPPGELRILARHSHRTMNQNPDDESVKGDFSVPSCATGAVTPFPSRRAELPDVDLRGRPLVRRHVVTRTVGSLYVQYYIGTQTRGPGAPRHRTYITENKLPFAYSIALQRWLPEVYFDSTFSPEHVYLEGGPERDYIYAKPPTHNWNVSCLNCHNTYPYVARLWKREGPARDRTLWRAGSRKRPSSGAALRAPGTRPHRQAGACRPRRGSGHRGDQLRELSLRRTGARRGEAGDPLRARPRRSSRSGAREPIGRWPPTGRIPW